MHDSLNRQRTQNRDACLLLRELRAQPVEPVELRVLRRYRDALVERVDEPAHFLSVHLGHEGNRLAGLGPERLQHTVRDRHLPAEASRLQLPATVAVDQPDRLGKGRAQGGLGLLVGHPSDRYAREGHPGLDQRRRGCVPAKSRRESRDDQNR